MPGSVIAQPERQLLLRRRLDARLTEMRDRARRAGAARQAQRDGERQGTQITTENPTFAKAALAERVFYAVMLMALPTVYIIDVMLLGPVAEFLASEGFPEDSLVVRAAPFVVPVMIIGLEMVVGAFRLAAYREHLAGDRGPGTYRTLTLLATLLALFLPAAGLALYLDAQTMMPDTLAGQAVLILPIALPIVLSLTCHLCIVLGARRMHEAKAWLAFHAMRRRLQRQQEAGSQTFARESTAAADLLVPYLRDLDEYNQSYQPHQAAGPFDHHTRAIINEVYGYEVLQAAPGTPAMPPPAPGPTDDATPQAGRQTEPATDAADVPDWQALQALQQRQDESEVRA